MQNKLKVLTFPWRRRKGKNGAALVNLDEAWTSKCRIGHGSNVRKGTSTVYQGSNRVALGGASTKGKWALKVANFPFFELADSTGLTMDAFWPLT